MERDELLQYVATKISNARSVNDIIVMLQSYKGLEAYEMMYCVALSSVLNGVELDRRTKQLESIKDSDLAQEDETLLN